MGTVSGSDSTGAEGSSVSGVGAGTTTSAGSGVSSTGVSDSIGVSDSSGATSGSDSTSVGTGGSSVCASTAVGATSTVGVAVGISVGTGVAVAGGARTLNTRITGLCVFPASSRPTTSSVWSALASPVGRNDQVVADSAVKPAVISCPSSLAFMIVTPECLSPEYSPISSAKLTVINGLDTSETSRLPGTTIGFFITVSSWN